MNEEMLIVPTQELAFAVKKDGSIISNFTEKRGGGEKKLMLRHLRPFSRVCTPLSRPVTRRF